MCKGLCVCVCRISTHQRLNSILLTGPTREERRISTFNAGMRTWFEAGHCGPAHVVDVYNMTNTLVTELGNEAMLMVRLQHLPVASYNDQSNKRHMSLLTPSLRLQQTYDQFHWSMVVNLIKVQILLGDIATALPTI